MSLLNNECKPVSGCYHWHLLHNLQEMLERWLATMYATLRHLPVALDLQHEVEKLMSRQYRTQG